MIVNNIYSDLNAISVDEMLNSNLEFSKFFIKTTTYFADIETPQEFAIGYLERIEWHQKIPHINKKYFEKENNVTKYTFVDDNKKAFMLIDGSIYHFIENTIPTIFFLYELDKKITFIISCDDKHEFIINSLKYIFLKYKINHIFLKDRFVLQINNFYEDPHLLQSTKTVDLITKYLLNNKQNKKPFKKIYLSRYVSRIKDEYLLEEYFKSNGFDIVYNENFKSIEDQISFYEDVAILISSTGTGQSSMIYMQSNQTVIELITPIFHKSKTISKNGYYSIDSFAYLNFAYSKKHKYIGIPSKYYADKIINDFESNKYLKDLIKNDLYEEH